MISVSKRGLENHPVVLALEDMRSSLVSYARRYVGEDAEDVYGDVCLNMVNGGVDTFNQVMDIRNWLGIAVRNKCTDYLRKRRIRPKKRTSILSYSIDEYSGERFYEPVSRDEGPSEIVVSREYDENFFRIVNGLSDKLRDVFVLRVCEGLKYDEIARKLEIPEGTVKSRLYYARAELKDKFERDTFFGDSVEDCLRRINCA